MGKQTTTCQPNKGGIDNTYLVDTCEHMFINLWTRVKKTHTWMLTLVSLTFTFLLRHNLKWGFNKCTLICKRRQEVGVSRRN